MCCIYLRIITITRSHLWWMKRLDGRHGEMRWVVCWQWRMCYGSITVQARSLVSAWHLRRWITRVMRRKKSVNYLERFHASAWNVTLPLVHNLQKDGKLALNVGWFKDVEADLLGLHSKAHLHLCGTLHYTLRLLWKCNPTFVHLHQSSSQNS